MHSHRLGQRLGDVTAGPEVFENPFTGCHFDTCGKCPGPGNLGLDRPRVIKALLFECIEVFAYP